jgi:hypothetical protein
VHNIKKKRFEFREVLDEHVKQQKLNKSPVVNDLEIALNKEVF